MPKIVIVGESQSGKSCFVYRYIHKKFTPNHNRTIAANFYSTSVNVHDTKIRTTIWDTAGDDRYTSLLSMYTRTSDAALIILNGEKSVEHNRKMLFKFLTILTECKSMLPVLISLSHYNHSDTPTKAQNITDILEFNAFQPFRAKLVIRGVRTHSSLDGTHVDEVMQELSLYAYLASELPALDKPQEVVTYCNFIIKLNSDPTHRHLAEEALMRLESPTPDQSERSELILSLISTESDRNYVLNLHRYLNHHSPKGDVDSLNHTLWEVGNRLYEQQLYGEAIALLSKITNGSEHHKAAYLIKRGCRLALGGNRDYTPADLHIPVEVEEAVIKIQSVYRARVCLFNYRNYKKIENQVKQHMTHGRLADATTALKELEVVANKMK